MFLERYQEATPLAERLMMLHPTKPAGWQRRAQILLCLEIQLPVADQMINQAIQLDPGGPAPLLIKAGIVYLLHRGGEARSLIKMVQAMNPPPDVLQASQTMLDEMNHHRGQKARHVSGTAAKVGFGLISALPKRSSGHSFWKTDRFLHQKADKHIKYFLNSKIYSFIQYSQ